MTTVIRFGTLLSIVFTLITICFMRNVEAAVYVPASGRTLFGSPSGSDANDCSMPAPCRQIRRALGLVQSGDLISVADGSYLGFNLEDKHGTACPQGLATDIGAYEQSASSSPVSAQQATFTNPLLTLPAVRVRDNIYHAKLAYLLASSPPEFQLLEAGLITTTAGSFTSSLENDVLVIPSVRVGATAYRAELTLINPALYRFRLKTLVLE